MIIESIRQTLDEVEEKLKGKATDYKEFEAELLKDPEVRKEYEALEPKYDKIRRELKGE